ncbi:MAG: solute carrier family 26 protein [Cryomorphaceae bacterium]|nr:solute carrier family 26 protein [Cryomorphaceae bacterium]
MITQQKLSKYIPALSWITGYQKSWLAGDISAGLTVGVMLIPQGMAYAMLAGLPPIHGLYAVTIPLFLYAIFGTSRQLAVGPVAMVSLLTAAGIGALEPTGPESYLLYAVTLAFMVGVIQAGMGLLRLGFVVNFLSHPVLSGFTSAAAIIIGLSQVKHLLKIDLPRSEHAHEIIIAMVKNIGELHWPTFALGIAGIIIIKYGKKIHKQFPAPLIAVIFGILMVMIFGLEENGVVVLGAVPAGLPGLSTPTFEMEAWRALIPVALAISLVGFAESYAVAKVVQQKHKDYRLVPNQELIGLGMANFGAALFQGYPVTGGFSRTAVNNQAGAKTGFASIISAFLILLTLLFLTGLFTQLPAAILAAVVIVAVSGLIDFKEPLDLWKKDKTDFFMLMATFLATLTLGIEIGIVTGLVLSLVAVIYRASRPHIARLGKVPNTDLHLNIKRFPELEEIPETLITRIDGVIYFANLEYIKDKIDIWIADRKAKKLVFDFSAIPHIDSSGVHALKSWIEDWKNSGIQVVLCGMHGPVRDVLTTWKVLELAGHENCCLTINEALGNGNGMDTKPYILQSNSKNK